MKENSPRKFARTSWSQPRLGDLRQVPMSFGQNATSLLVLAGALISLPVCGQTLSATYTKVTPALNVTGTWDSGANVNAYPAGQLQFTNFDAFCVEPGESLGSELLIYDIQSPGSLANINTIKQLVGGFLASSKAGEEAAAFQWAIWEVTSESLSSWNLLDGNVMISTADSTNVATLANSYLANVGGFSSAQITYLTHSTRQDVVAWNIIPEPSAAALVVLSGLLFFRRRRG